MIRSKVQKRLAVLALLLAGLFLLFPAKADGGSVTVSSATCMEGEEAVITITLSEPINTGNITVYFDSARLEYVSYAAENTVPNVDGNNIHLITVFMDADVHQMSYTLVFRAVKEGSAAVGIAAITLSDGGGNPILVSQANDGLVVIHPKATEAPETDPTTEAPTDPPTDPSTEAPTEAPT